METLKVAVFPVPDWAWAITSLPDSGVNGLEDGDAEGCSFSCTRLGLGNHISPLDDGLDGPLLNCTGLLESIGIDSPEQILPESHTVECGDHFHILRRLELHVGHVLLHRSATLFAGCSRH